MPDYDGSVRIRYDIDTKDAEKAQQDFGEKTKQSAEELAEKIEILKKKKEALEKIGVPKDAKIYEETARELERLEQELVKVQAEQKKAAESSNYFKRELEKYQQTLKELEGKGLYFGDEEYDRAYAAMERLKGVLKVYKSEVEQSTDSQGKFTSQIAQLKSEIASMEREGMGLGTPEYDQAIIDLQNLIDKQSEYRKSLMEQTDKSKDLKAQEEAAAQQKAQEAEEKRRQAEEARIEAIRKKEEEKRAKEAAAMAEAEAKERQIIAIKESSTVADQKIVQLAEQRKTLLEEIKRLESAGVGYGYKEYDEKKAKIAEIEQKIREYANSTQKAAGDSKKSFSKISAAGKKMEKAVKGSADKSGKHMGRFGSRMKGILLSLFVFNWISKGFQAMVNAMKEGFTNLVKHSKGLNVEMSALKSQTTMLKNNLAAAFEPVVSAVLPYITKLVGGLNTASNALARFLALISGKKSYTIAKKQTTDYAKSLDKATGSAQKALAAFDDLNVLGSGSGSGSGGGFEEVMLGDADFAWLDGLLEKFQPVIDAVERFKASLEPIQEFAFQGLMDFYNLFLVPVGEWTIGTGIPGFLDALTTMNNAIDWEKLNGAFAELWKSLAPFATNVGEGLLWFWENVMTPLGAWTMNELVPVFLDLLSDGLDVLNEAIEALKPTWEWFWENVLKPAAEWTGEVIIEAFRLLTEKLKAFSEWCKTDKQGVELMKNAITALMAVLTYYLITKGLPAIIAGAVKIFISFGTAIWTAATSAGGAAILFGALAFAIITLAKNWDKLSTGEKILAGLAAAAMAAAIAVAVFHTSWSLGTAAVAIAAGLALLGLSFAALQRSTNSVDLGSGTHSGAGGLHGGAGGSFYNSHNFNGNPLPMFAAGGIVSRPTVGVIGEAGTEAVMPLENNTGWISDLADKIAERMPGNSGPVYLQIDGETFARLEGPYLSKESSRRGVSFRTT